MLHISDRVVRPKVHLEFQDEFVKIIHPCRTEHRILHLKEVRFEPFKGHLQVQLCKCDFGMVHTEGPWAILEIQLTLDKEDLEFVGICPVKLVGLLDLGAKSRVGG